MRIYLTINGFIHNPCLSVLLKRISCNNVYNDIKRCKYSKNALLHLQFDGKEAQEEAIPFCKYLKMDLNSSAKNGGM